MTNTNMTDYIHCDTVGCEKPAEYTILTADNNMVGSYCEACYDAFKPAYENNPREYHFTSLY